MDNCKLAILQYALLFFAKNQMHHAAFMAARAGSMQNADVQAITSTYAQALIPLYGGGRNNQELAKSFANVQKDILGDANTPASLKIERLNPTKESFDDWSDATLQAKLKLGKSRVIPFASQAFKDAGNIKAHSGQNIFDANILKIKIIHGFTPQVPLMKTLYTVFLKWLDTGTDPFQTQLINSGRIPIISSVSIHMQSNAIESGALNSNPGMGNNGKPIDVALPLQKPAPFPSSIKCTMINCTPINPTPPSSTDPNEPNTTPPSCIGEHCPVCEK
ncbi:MAG: TadE family protein [Pseudomonadota bacterium]